MRKTAYIIAGLVWFWSLPLSGEEGRGPLKESRRTNRGSYTIFEEVVTREKQERILTFLTDDLCQGRESGTKANMMAAGYICDKFKEYGVMTFTGGSYFQRFMIDSTTIGCNVTGVIWSSVPSTEYVIVTAHYDHLGTIGSAVYNGADDNASGVTAMLNLAEMFGAMKRTRTGPDKNIIFVALDAKERNMAGAEHFIEKLHISRKMITCAINLERIGTILEPVHHGTDDFVIVLGENNLPKEKRGKIARCNKEFGLNLDIDFTFYGSKNFTDLYYRLSDQIKFHEAGIPALLFTSGFHKHTYKVSDDPQIISYPQLRKRTFLIFYFITSL